MRDMPRHQGAAKPAASRNREDFAAVAATVAPRLYRIGLRMCGRPEDAEDLVQDTLLQGFRKWNQFQGRANASTWLYTIAARLCQRRHRRRAGEPARVESLSELLPSANEPIPALTSGDNPLDEHVRREAERAVGTALAMLPTPFRLPLVLADIGELSTSDIAGVLGLKEATVKTRIHRARLAIRRALVSRLPSRPAAPPDHERQMCLDLLAAKQEAMDRCAPFPLSSQELCVRCRALFQTLDLGRDVCVSLATAELPESLRALIRSGGAGDPARRRRGPAPNDRRRATPR
jgi:RNA polymerase sigma-70 factor (ECF subfamily)